MNVKTIEECTALSLEGTTPFPEIVMKLIAAGVERYTVDLAAAQKRTYGLEGEYHESAFPFSKGASIPLDFDAAAVKQAITASQQEEIKYTEFLGLIIKAGCCHYDVCITGRKAVYFGRKGDSHTELFPSAK